MIYFDNAATTFPKPPEVANAVYQCMNYYCGNPGRGSHDMARAAADKLFETRCLLADFFKCPSPENIIFTMNTTYALNIAIKAFVSDGDRILISDMEHNSVLRPVHALVSRNKITYDLFPTFGGREELIIRHLKKQITNDTKVLVCQHASNICGTLLPIKKIGELCRKSGIYFIVDAAQSAGLIDIDMTECNIDALCVPSHKGLYGPQGIGIILLSQNVRSNILNTLIEGGSGTGSLSLDMPRQLPDRFEAGTMPTPAIAGLCEGIKFVIGISPSAIRDHEMYLSTHLKSALSQAEGVQIYRPDVLSSIVLFNIKGLSPAYVSTELNRYGICVRSGFHCAPLAHKTVGTGENGAVRISFSAFNNLKEVNYTVEIIKKMSSI